MCVSGSLTYQTDDGNISTVCFIFNKSMKLKVDVKFAEKQDLSNNMQLVLVWGFE